MEKISRCCGYNSNNDGGRTVRQISSDLIKAGMNKNIDAAIIENATTAGQRVVKGTVGTLVDISNEAQIKPPAIIVIGKVVSLHEKLSWLHSIP